MRHGWTTHKDFAGTNHFRSQQHSQQHTQQSYGAGMGTASHFGQSHTHLSSVLHDKNVLITSSGNTAEKLAGMLNQKGANPIFMPIIEIGEPDSWHGLDEAIEHIDSYQWLFFASSNAVASFCKRWQHAHGSLPVTFRATKQLPKIAVIGKATAETAKEYGLSVAYFPTTYVAEDFVAQFPGFPHLHGQRILWPRTDIGRDFIINGLENAGAQMNVVPAYKTSLPVHIPELCARLNQLIADEQLDVITLASHQTAVNLYKIISLILEQNRRHKLLSEADCEAFLKSDLEKIAHEERAQIAHFLEKILIVTIGPQTAEGALNYLGKATLQANSHTSEGMLSVLIDYYRKCKL